MNIFKKVSSFLLAVIIVFVGLPICNIVRAEDEYIYLSDIYFAYPSYISKSTVLDEYTDDTLECLYITLDNYLESDSFVDSEVKTVMQNNPANVIDYIQMFLSGFFGANYVKDDAIELANELFVQKLLDTNSVENAAAVDEFAEKIIALCDVYEEFTAEVNGTELADAEILTKAMEHLQNAGILSKLTSSHVSDMLSALIPNIKTASGLASIGGDMIKLGKTYMLAALLEDERLRIVGDILDNAQTGTTLYTGMSRLYDDINSGFGAYVYDNYVTGGMLDKLAEKAVDKIVESALGSTATLIGIVGLVFEISAGIFFADTPALNEIMLQMVLTDYVNGMQAVVYAFDDRFEDE